MTGLRLVSSSAHWLFQARYTGYLDNKGPFITSEAVTTLGALSPEIILPKASLSSTFIDLSSLLVDGKRVDPCQKPWITHQFQGQRKSKGLMVSVCVLRGFTLKLLHFNSSVSWEEELSAGEWGTEIAMSCAGCKKSCVCRGFDLSVCVCVCVWTKACISLIVRNNPPSHPALMHPSLHSPPQPSGSILSIYVLIYCVSPYVCGGCSALLAITQSETTPSCAESLQYWQRNDHFLAMQKMPSCLEIEPIELTLFNGQTSKPFPQRGCHFWMSWPFLTAFKNLQGLQGVVCQWKEFKDYRGGGNWRRGDANAPLLMGASV